MGNHEEMFLDLLEDIEVLRPFLRFGGRETVLSYGIDRSACSCRTARMLMMIRGQCPQRTWPFYSRLRGQDPDRRLSVRPRGRSAGRAAVRADPPDPRWIREPFPSHPAEFGFAVVHGHTISTPDIPHNRIVCRGLVLGTADRAGAGRHLALAGRGRRQRRGDPHRAKEHFMKIAMVGSGYVGLVSGPASPTSATTWSASTRIRSRSTASPRIMPIYEPGLAELVGSNVKAGRLSFTTDLAEGIAGHRPSSLLSVHPAQGGDGHADLSFVHAVACRGC